MKRKQIKGAMTGITGALALAGGSQAYASVVNVATPANLTNTAGGGTVLPDSSAMTGTYTYWDVNGDGINDFLFEDRYPNTDPLSDKGVIWQLRMQPATTALASSNNVIGYGTSATFKYATSLNAGVTIGAGGAFSGGATTLVLGSQYTYGGTPSYYGGFAYAKPPGTNAYAGFRFAAGGSTYYGWVQLSVSAGKISFVNAAYDDAPDTAITAGALAVPEPGSMAALAVGAAAVLGAVAKRRLAGAV